MALTSATGGSIRLRQYMRTINPLCPNFLDSCNLSFSSFHTALDNIFPDLRLKGVGSESKVTEAFTKDEEELLVQTHGYHMKALSMFYLLICDRDLGRAGLHAEEWMRITRMLDKRLRMLPH